MINKLPIFILADYPNSFTHNPLNIFWNLIELTINYQLSIIVIQSITLLTDAMKQIILSISI